MAMCVCCVSVKYELSLVQTSLSECLRQCDNVFVFELLGRYFIGTIIGVVNFVYLFKRMKRFRFRLYFLRERDKWLNEQ